MIHVLFAAALAGDPSHFVTGAGTVVFPMDAPAEPALEGEASLAKLDEHGFLGIPPSGEVDVRALKAQSDGLTTRHKGRDRRQYAFTVPLRHEAGVVLHDPGPDFAGLTTLDDKAAVVVFLVGPEDSREIVAWLRARYGEPVLTQEPRTGSWTGQKAAITMTVVPGLPATLLVYQTSLGLEME